MTRARARSSRSSASRSIPAALADPTSGVLSARREPRRLLGLVRVARGPHRHEPSLRDAARSSTTARPTANLVEDGFLAKTRADEKNDGPQRARVRHAGGHRRHREDARRPRDDQGRPGALKEIEKRQKELVAACEKDRPGMRCSVVALLRRRAVPPDRAARDPRRPPRLGAAARVGNYGGEIDNWRWPRHTGDFSFFRAYVGKDGKPADYSPDNVPYKPTHSQGRDRRRCSEGDLVFVAGYPGRTSTLKTKAEVDEAVTWAYPRRQKLFEDYLARLEEATKDDKEAQIRATSYVRRFGNALTNTKGQLDGLVKGGLAQDKEKSEKALREFVAADPSAQGAWGKALDEIAAEIAKSARIARRTRSSTSSRCRASSARRRRSCAWPRSGPKPDAERDPGLPGAQLAAHRAGLEGLTTSYHRKVDEAVLGLALERIARSPEAERTPAFALSWRARRTRQRRGIKKAVVDALRDDHARRREGARRAAEEGHDGGAQGEQGPAHPARACSSGRSRRRRRNATSARRKDGAPQAEVHRGAEGVQEGAVRSRREQHAPHHLRHGPRLQPTPEAPRVQARSPCCPRSSRRTRATEPFDVPQPVLDARQGEEGRPVRRRASSARSRSTSSPTSTSPAATPARRR